MSVFMISGLSVAVAGTLLAALVALFGSTPIHRRLLAFNVAVAIWGLGLGLAGLAESPAQARAAWLVAHSGGLFVAPTFLHLVCTFAGLDRRGLVWAGYLQAVGFLAAYHGTALVLQDFVATPHGLFPTWTSVHLASILGYFVFVIVAYVELFRLLPRTVGVRRFQALFITYGFMVGFLGATTTFLPMFGVQAIPPWGNFGITLYCVMLTFAILRYSFLHLRIALRRSLVFSLAATIVTVVALEVAISLSGPLVEIIGVGLHTGLWAVALLVGIAFTPLANLLERLVGVLVPEEGRVFEGIIQQTTERLRNLTHTREVARTLAVALDDALTPEDVVIFEVSGGALVPMKRSATTDGQDAGEGEALPLSAPELAALARLPSVLAVRVGRNRLDGDGVSLVERLEERRSWELVVRLDERSTPRFVLCAGRLSGGARLTARDLELVRTLSDQAAMALRGARLLEDLDSANRELRREMDRTVAAEAATRTAAQEWRATLDAASDAVIAVDASRRVARLNKAAASLFGLPVTDAPGRVFSELVGALGWTGLVPAWFLEGPGRASRTAELHDPMASAWYTVSADPVRDPTGPAGWVCTIRDTSALKRMELAIEAERDDWAASFATINDAITVHDADFNIIRANAAATELLGLSLDTVLGQKCFASYHGTGCPPDGCPSCETLQTATPSINEVFEPHLGKHLEIEALPRVDANGEVYGLIHVVRDVSERRAAEEERARLSEQLLQSQKMECVGQLAGGVAHDFNNMLSVIQTCAELALEDCDEADPVREDLRTIHEAGRQAAKVTAQLLALSRKHVLDIQPLDLAGVVGRMGSMLARVIGEHIEMTLSSVPSPWPVEGDAAQLEQVVMNLAINARDSMPGGGTLEITTRPVTLDVSARAEHGGAPAGRYVLLAVRDTGRGIPRQVRERIFEPFFTTKAEGEGTGLGLATSYAVVTQHDGFVAVESEVGRGTIFRIYLPASEREERTRPTTEEAEVGGTETILVVDDEPAVRGVGARTLRRLGYRVLEAGSGAEALDIAVQHPEPIDLLVTDVVMPGMAFAAYIDRFERENGETRLLFVSGYTDDLLDGSGALERGAVFVQKPLTPSVLGPKVREALDVG